MGEGQRKSERYRANYVIGINFLHCAVCCWARGTLAKMPAGLRKKMIEIDSEILRLYNINKEK